MSACLLNHYHINMLVSYASLYGISLPDPSADRSHWWVKPLKVNNSGDGQTAGRALIGANIASLDARYPKHPSSADEHLSSYHHALVLNVITPIVSAVERRTGL